MNSQYWINVYPTKSITLKIVNVGARVHLGKELSDYCNKQWELKAAKGWKNSWVAFVERLSYSSNKKHSSLTVHTGAMPFLNVWGITTALEEKKSFAPEEGYFNCLSLGFLTATKDAKVIFQRRAPDVHCPNILIHEPCGYITSLAFAPREECDLEKYADDERLFDLEVQYDFRRDEIAKTFGVPSELVSYRIKQDLLAAGWMTKEMYFSTTGKIDANSNELTLPQNQEIFFVPFEHLKELIYNQPKLLKEDATLRPSDARQIPLIDESLIGLIYGYEHLTGDKIDIPETIDRLNHDGMNIRVYPVFGDCKFQTKF